MDLERIKGDIRSRIDQASQELIELCRKIHRTPELGWEEENAAAWLSNLLEKNGFQVNRRAGDLPTAFTATRGRGTPLIAFLAEYDALPGIGHGCGHNIIGTAAAGAAIAVKDIVDATGASVMVVGCPAEELLGGKAILVDRGIFSEVDAALQIHPAARPENRAGFTSTATVMLDVEYFGRESHAAAGPWEGNSALQALINAFNNINGLRLQTKDGSRISGIIVKGGEAVNIIPAFASGKFQIRSPEEAYLDELKDQVFFCVDAAAAPVGCRMEHRWGNRCNAMVNNDTILDLWKANMNALGRQVNGIVQNSGSTDTANVSITVPTIHAFVSISRETLPFHSNPFSEAAGSESGMRAMIDGAKAMAMTAADLISKPEVLKAAQQELAASKAR